MHVVDSRHVFNFKGRFEAATQMLVVWINGTTRVLIENRSYWNASSVSLLLCKADLDIIVRRVVDWAAVWATHLHRSVEKFFNDVARSLEWTLESIMDRGKYKIARFKSTWLS